MVTIAYRSFCRDRLPYEERFRWTPSEDVDYREVNNETPVLHLVFLLQKNTVGQDALAVAEAAEYENIVHWIEQVLKRLDSNNRHNDLMERKRIEEFIPRCYQHEVTEMQQKEDEIGGAYDKYDEDKNKTPEIK
jgi:hypothetical protein